MQLYIIYDLGKYTVSRKEIIDFAKKYDPFPFHVDDEAAAETVFGGIISSGWLTSLIWLRLMHQNFLTYETILGSPGHEEVKWPNPVRPDLVASRFDLFKPKNTRSYILPVLGSSLVIGFRLASVSQAHLMSLQILAKCASFVYHSA